MNKLKMESVDITEQNIDRIAELFPQVVTEVADPSGAKNDDGTPRLRKAIDFEKLKLVLSAGSGDYVVADDDRERYEFTWVGKRQSMIDAAKPIRKTLRPCPEESKNWDSTENLYIEGDNLEVLKLLQESYLGKVKMIYIDPPYNTGNDFVYRDKWSVDSDEWSERIGEFDEDENRLFQNTETNGRFHSDWCSMIYPRLQLARNLLTDDGVIFISIDDNEVENLKKICNEVLGEDNFVAIINWKGRGGRQDSKYYAAVHEYIIVYAKDIRNFIAGEDIKNGDIFPKYDKEKDRYYKTQLLRKWGSNSRREDRPNLFYPIKAPDGTDVYPMLDNSTYCAQNFANFGCWRHGASTMQQNIADGRIEFIKKDNGAWVPYEKIFAPINGEATKKYTTWIDESNNGAKVVKDLFGSIIFDYPKTPDLLLRFIKMANVESTDIILDFFSGSATTAHAVMQLNAEDGGNRKFIMVQLPEKTDEKSEAYKAGYKNICEIGKERIRRAGEKVVSEQQRVISDEWSVISKEEKQRYGCKELSRAECLAKVNGGDQTNLFNSEKTTEGGDLCAVGSDAKSSNINSVEHSRGASTQLDEGVPTISGNSQRLESGAGNSTTAVRESGIPCRYGYFRSDADVAGGEQDAKCPFKGTAKCPLTTNHSSLTTDIGFRVFKADTTNMKDVYYAAGELSQKDLFDTVSNIKDDRSDIDLLYGCLLDWGVQLSMPHSTEKIEGYTVHTVNSPLTDEIDLVACFDSKVSESVIRTIAERKPTRAVFRDASFADSANKINVFEIFKSISPDTTVKVI